MDEIYNYEVVAQRINKANQLIELSLLKNVSLSTAYNYCRYSNELNRDDFNLFVRIMSDE